jgi:hypothetical protein
MLSHPIAGQPFVRQILRELKDKRERLYSTDGRQMPIRGNAVGLALPSAQP